jgi:hypothetical protein
MYIKSAAGLFQMISKFYLPLRRIEEGGGGGTLYCGTAFRYQFPEAYGFVSGLILGKTSLIVFSFMPVYYVRLEP